MKNFLQITQVVTLAIIISVNANAAAATWNGSVDQNWSTGGNWTGGTGTGGVPGTADTATFSAAGETGSTGVNNIVDQNFSITGLTYSETTGFYNTQINSPQTLTLSGNLTDNVLVTNLISGTGTFSMTGGSGTFNFGEGVAGGLNRLDMSGLNVFSASVSTFYGASALGGGNASFGGTLLLAKTNIITATTINVGAGGSANTTGGNAAFLYLGQTNQINAGSITTGNAKGVAFVFFQPGLSSPSVYFRGSSGDPNRVSNWTLEDRSLLTGSGTTATGSTNDFTAGSIDARVDVMTIGKGGSSTSSGATGLLKMGAGNFDVNTLNIGAAGSGTEAGFGLGTFTITNGTLVVNNVVGMGTTAGTSISGALTGTKGTLNIFNSTAKINSITNNSGAGGGVITITNSTLYLTNNIGLATTPNLILALTNDVIHLSLDGNTAATPKIYVTTLNTLSSFAVPTNSIVIDSVANVSSPTTFSIINYGTYNGNVLNFTSTVPAGYTVTAPSVSGSTIQITVSLVDHAPVIANIVTNSVNSGLTLKIAISDLATAAGWSDADSDSISLSSVGPTSTLGNSVTKDSTFVYYNAPVTAEDHFTYTISDGTLSANGTVYVEAITSNSQTYNITGSVVNNDNSITLSGASIPGRTNVIQRTGDLTPPISWTPVGTNVVDGTGHWQFTDPPTPPNPSFYRSVTQP